MTGDWIATLSEKVAQANVRNGSLFAKLGDNRREIAQRLDRTVAQLGRVADARDRPADTLSHQRVIRAMRERAFETLSIRERRYAATLFADIGADEMQPFLETYPRNWRSFVVACFRRWDEFDQVERRPAYTRLLCLAPPTVPFLHQVARPQDLVTSTGPGVLGRSIQANDLIELADVLRHRGFDLTWSFTANAVAAWMAERTQLPGAFDRAWVALSRDRTIEAMLLPPLARSSSSWFSSEPRPARVRQSTAAHATFVAALIRAAYSGGAQNASWSAFSETLLRSTFGDPRIPPDSEGWKKLRHRDEPAYQRFLEQLISEDITVFFEHAMTDPRRKAFWLSYVRSLRRTVCILDLGTHERLTQKLAGAETTYAAAISRARKFTSRKCVQAFCLYFDRIVVVEFAETGNAARIYTRAHFEEKFEQAIYKDRCRDHGVLKTPIAQLPGVGERILHTANWESDTEDKLRELGISRDRTPVLQHASHR
jgi:hypothetical protein